MRKTKRLKKLTAATLAVSMLGSAALTGITPSQVKAADTADAEWDEIQSIVSRYYGEWNDTSYSGLVNNQMPNTALLGNGDVGVASGGNSKEKKFYISKGDFWTFNEGQIALGGVTIHEKEKQETDTNLPLNYKNATASSVHEQFGPEKAVNGTMTDANDMWCTAIGKEHWLQLEFDAPITFSRWVLKFDEALRPGLPDISANTASDFKLQVSENGQTWTDVSDIKGNKDAVFDESLEESVTAKYVRVYFTKPTQETTSDSQQNPRARVAEFELYAKGKDQVKDDENLALNKSVEVSSQWIGEAKGTLVDGNDGTQWTSSTDARNAKEHWAIVDLGEEKTIGYWMLKNSTEKGCATSDFQLQYSNDKTNWTNFATVTDNTDTTVTGALETPISARYIRLSITKGTQKDNQYARIKELELYENYVAPLEPFYEKQDILNAEIQTKQKIADVNTEMTTWLAADKNIMVTELDSKSNKPAEMEIETWAANNQENGRQYVSSEMDDRTLREIYLRPFEMMTKETDGIIISDWGAVKDRAYSLLASIEMCMPYQEEAFGQLKDAYEKGIVDDEVIDAALTRLFLYYDRTKTVYEPSECDFGKHHELAIEAANKSFVLLKNENHALPLDKNKIKKLLVIREGAVHPFIGGDGSSRVANPTQVDIPLEELKKELGEDVVIEFMGADKVDFCNNEIGPMEIVERGFDADAIIVFANQNFACHSESIDRDTIVIPPTLNMQFAQADESMIE